jgi:hypothetical protein
VKHTIHGCLEIADLFLVLNMTSHSFVALTLEISCSTLEINLLFPRTYVVLSMYIVILYIVILYIIILYNVHCTLYIVHCPLYTVHCTLHIAHCTLHIAHCTLYIVHCTLYIVHCILYIVYNILAKLWISLHYSSPDRNNIASIPFRSCY